MIMIAKDTILQHILNMFVNVLVQTRVALLGIVIHANQNVHVHSILIAIVDGAAIKILKYHQVAKEVVVVWLKVK